MSFDASREQEKAAAEPRMREPVSMRVRCGWCRQLTDEWEDEVPDGVTVCADCWEEHKKKCLEEEESKDE